MDKFKATGETAKPINLSERLRYCAQKVGSGNELSRVTGISRRALENWLNGTREPKASALAVIAEKSKVSAKWLLLGEGDPEASIENIVTKQEGTISNALLTKVRTALTQVRAEAGLRLRDSDFDWFFDYIVDKAEKISAIAETEEQEDLLIKMLVAEERDALQYPSKSSVTDQSA